MKAILRLFCALALCAPLANCGGGAGGGGGEGAVGIQPPVKGGASKGKACEANNKPKKEDCDGVPSLCGIDAYCVVKGCSFDSDCSDGYSCNTDNHTCNQNCYDIDGNKPDNSACQNHYSCNLIFQCAMFK